MRIIIAGVSDQQAQAWCDQQVARLREQTDDAGVLEWWAGVVSWLRQQCDALRAAGHTHESAAAQYEEVGLCATWPLLAERMLDKGYIDVIGALGFVKAAEDKKKDEQIAERDATIAERDATIAAGLAQDERKDALIEELTKELAAAKALARRQAEELHSIRARRSPLRRKGSRD